MKRGLVAAMAAVLMISACNSQPTSGGGGSKPSPSPSSTGIEGYSASEWARLWAEYGVSPAPADDPMTVHKPVPPKLQNLTRGAVSDADAQKWAEGLLRAYSAVQWSEEHLAEDVLSRGLAAPAFATTNIFDISIPRIQQAKQNGVVRIETTYRSFGALALVAVPPDLISQYSSKAPLTKYAFLTLDTGPTDVVLVHSDGRREEQGARNDPPEEFVVSGEYVERGKHVSAVTNDLPFAPFWFQQSSWSCQRHADLANLCAQLSKG